MLYEIHMLKNYPPTNLNRDDTGSPKTCIFGDATRSRISSQSLKNSWRKSEIFYKEMENAGIPIATVDEALFGSVVTPRKYGNMESSIQVAHAISTNKITMEKDCFTAMDDILRGTAMIEKAYFNSACYYIYASIDSEILKDNLKDEENCNYIVIKTILAFIRTMVFTNPSGKQNSFAGNVLPSAILIDCKDRGHKVSTNMVNAYREPVYKQHRNNLNRNDKGEKDLVERSIEKLAIEADKISTECNLLINQRIWFCMDKYNDIKPITANQICETFESMIGTVEDVIETCDLEITKKTFVALRLEGLMQSWGESAIGDYRETTTFPTKSGVVGLIGCAMGISRGNPELTSLSDSIQIAVRADRPGTKIIDFQTVTGNPLLTAQNVMEDKKVKRTGGDTITPKRVYLLDASFLVLIDVKDIILRERIVSALKAPKWCVYLGRKNCIPSRPIFEGVTSDYSNLLDAAQNYSISNYNKILYIESEGEVDDPMASYTRIDKIDKRESGYRSFTGRKAYKTYCYITEENLLIDNDKVFHPENLLVKTVSERYVRSKEEALIANFLYYENIPYIYEKQLTAPDGTHYNPDFTIEFGGVTYYWEHFGMTNSSDYRVTMKKKIKWYDKYFPGKLIATYGGVVNEELCAEVLEKIKKIKSGR